MRFRLYRYMPARTANVAGFILTALALIFLARDGVMNRVIIALAELIRQGGFDREVLIVAMPTGTGWMDPGAMDPVEYMHGGDIATVAVQYSYLQSPLALVLETRSGLDQAEPPFPSVRWQNVVASRNPGSPYVAPVLGDGRLVTQLQLLVDMLLANTAPEGTGMPVTPPIISGPGSQ
ncbi:alpha/beta-hydrolase family protein [Aliiroseovarius sediminis]|uniref:alpha/beta-hydrolase family protein n=1 Tax=Aliiroseovarius sediminis TaxID=2925839 RepID=UPI001F58A017|nr:alpha/beta-hydrolase family protein [uncultured Aliiroseovarius sp.]MCI2394828.1 alpha/beta-hydrolase family protein [Aliiroseovarius sediminis]